MTNEQITQFIDNAKNSLITTIDKDGYPVTRAMLSVRYRDELNALYFSTNTSSNKVSEIQKNSKGSIYFFDPNNYIGLSLKGSFTVTIDLTAKNKVWHNNDELYYPKGIMDEDFCVLIFKIQSGRIYSNFSSKDF